MEPVHHGPIIDILPLPFASSACLLSKIGRYHLTKRYSLSDCWSQTKLCTRSLLVTCAFSLPVDSFELSLFSCSSADLTFPEDGCLLMSECM